jgi:site-specific recombinase XerD
MKKHAEENRVTQNECCGGFACALQSRGVAKRTTNAYLVDLAQFFRFHGLSFEGATAAQITALPPDAVSLFINALVEGGGHFTTVRRHLSSLRAFYDHLITVGVATENPARKIRLASLSRDPLPEEKILKIFGFLSEKETFGGEAFRLRDELMLLFILFLGVRSYRIPQLTLTDLRKGDPAPSLRVSPRKSLPIDGVILRRLHEYLKIRPQGSEALFASQRRDRAIPSSALEALLAKISEAIGRELTPLLLSQTSLWLQQNPERSNAILAKIGR